MYLDQQNSFGINAISVLYNDRCPKPQVALGHTYESLASTSGLHSDQRPCRAGPVCSQTTLQGSVYQAINPPPREQCPTFRTLAGVACPTVQEDETKSAANPSKSSKEKMCLVLCWHPSTSKQANILSMKKPLAKEGAVDPTGSFP